MTRSRACDSSARLACASLCALVALSACSGGDPGASPGSSTMGGAAAGGGPTRATIACSDALAGVASGDQLTATPGTWGQTPAALQALPPGATLCGSLTGSNINGDTVPEGTLLLTNLWGQALHDYYAPRLSGIGCTAQPPDAHSEIDFTCSSGDTGLIVPDPGYQFADILYF